MFQFKNFAKSELAAQLIIAGSSLSVQTGEGARFPDTGSTNIFRGVIWGASFATPFDDSTREVVEAYRSSGDTFTIVRAQEGTSAKQWEIGDNFMLTATAATLDSLKANSSINAPRGFLLNGKITVTDSGSGLVVAIKTLAGNDPSTSDPIHIRIGDTIRSITSALSRTLADGTKWMNAGSAELATKEIDYFVYLVWDSNSSEVGLTFARIPYANLVSDFSATTTNEKYCAGYSDFTTTDEVENIGRFAATLSAGTGYTWSVPTFTASNLIQRPIFETRALSFTPTLSFTAGTAPTTLDANFSLSIYKIDRDKVLLNLMRVWTVAGATVTIVNFTVPFASISLNGATSIYIGSGRIVPSVVNYCSVASSSSTFTLVSDSTSLTQVGGYVEYEI